MKKVALVAAGALVARAALSGVRAAPRADALRRTNFRGRSVTLAGGPALTVGATASAALGAGTPWAAGAALVAGLGAGAVGGYDDLVGGRPEHQAKGVRGHLAALRQGRVTSGLVKLVGLGAAGLVASALLPDRRGVAWRGTVRRGVAWRGTVRRGVARRGTVQCGAVHTLLGAGLIAGSANLVNLLDLRPGRALKAGLLIGAPLLGAGPVSSGLAAGPVGAAAALLPDDLGEEIMLGDCGANALGALLGVALAARTGPVGRALLLAGIAGLTVVSERVSFTEVIGRTPGLRELDALGRSVSAVGLGRRSRPIGLGRSVSVAAWRQTPPSETDRSRVASDAAERD